MVQVKKYQLPPTSLVPNSPRPLLHYPGILPIVPSTPSSPSAHCSPASTNQIFAQNGWQTQWIFRYGDTQDSHYHSRVHECMAVLSGEATIRFGVADSEHDPGDEERQNGHEEEKGIEVSAKAGDVFILPAGTAHKTFAARPRTQFALLTPGHGHQDVNALAENQTGEEGQNVGDVLDTIELTGFTMLGAYPLEGGEWDFQRGGEDVGSYEAVWGVAKPERDPVLGLDEAGLVGLWD